MIGLPRSKRPWKARAYRSLPCALDLVLYKEHKATWRTDAGREMDAIDTKILRFLQEDASISIAELAQRVNLSQTPCWKRIQRLESSGVIKGRVALVDPEKIGLSLTAF